MPIDFYWQLIRNLTSQTTPMPEDNNCDNQKNILHHARRNFLKQSVAATAIVLVPPAIVNAAKGKLDEKAADFFDQQTVQIEVTTSVGIVDAEPTSP